MRAWLALYLLATLLDVATTTLGLSAGIPEGNPLAARRMAEWGETATYLVKLLGALVVVGLAWRIRRRTVWPARLLCLAMVGVVVNNTILLVG